MAPTGCTGASLARPDIVEGDVRAAGVSPLSQLRLDGLYLRAGEVRANRDVDGVALLPGSRLALGRRGLAVGLRRAAPPA